MQGYVTQTMGNRGSRKSQMGEQTTILMMLIRILFIECLLCTKSHAEGFIGIAPFHLPSDPGVGTLTVSISQMRKIRFRDVNSLTNREMDLGCQLRQTNS